MSKPQEVFLDLFLAIDTSGPEPGLVLSGAGRHDVAPLEAGPTGNARTEDLSAVAGRLLSGRGASVSDLAMVAAVVGPGSYTGLRSGLAFLRGLSFGTGLPAVSVGSLELLAWRGGAGGDSVVAASDAGSGRYAVARYAVWEEDVEEELAPTIVHESDCRAFLEAAGPSSALVMAAPDAPSSATFAEAARSCGVALRAPAGRSIEKLAELAESRWKRGRTARVGELLPVYVGETRARPNRNRVAVLDSPE